jgi:hypothetical protein
MHLGIVHDDGPDQMGQDHMERRPRFGMIYTFPHPENDEKKLVGFRNGVRGIANRSYLRLDVVALDDGIPSANSVEVVCGKIINRDDPSNPNIKIIQNGLTSYNDWANQKDSKEMIDSLRKVLDQLKE